MIFERTATKLESKYQKKITLESTKNLKSKLFGENNFETD